ncbi:MAG: hypothetical protein AB1486_25460 [Planctomycetota bacterium]
MTEAPAVIPKPPALESPSPIGRPPQPERPAQPRPFKERCKQGFFRFSERFGHMLSRLVITILYATLVVPGGIIVSLLQDPLRIKRYRGTTWSDWKSSNHTLQRARRQD